jgi:hypothetical protein
MIEAGLEFETDLTGVLGAFATLPDAVRPVHFSKNETPDNAADHVSERARLLSFAQENGSGFFLLSPTVTYSIRIAAGRPIVCDCFLNVGSPEVRAFMVHMAAADPAFGFACLADERTHRNRIVHKVGDQAIEGWVGRDIRKYLPGFYWMTLLSETLATKHGLPVERLDEAAREHLKPKTGQHLFVFFERPEEWTQHTERLDALCASLRGVFSKRAVLPQLAGAKNVIEVTSVVAMWR